MRCASLARTTNVVHAKPNFFLNRRHNSSAVPSWCFPWLFPALFTSQILASREKPFTSKILIILLLIWSFMCILVSASRGLWRPVRRASLTVLRLPTLKYLLLKNLVILFFSLDIQKTVHSSSCLWSQTWKFSFLAVWATSGFGHFWRKMRGMIV